MEVVFLCIFTAILLYVTLLKPFFRERINLPPGPKPWPIVGNLLLLGKMPHVTLATMARTYGPIISLKLGTQRFIVASSPAAVAEIFKKNDRITSARYIPQTYRSVNYIGYSLTFSFDCNERWKSLRSLCKAGLFTTKVLDLQAHTRGKKVGEMISFLFSKRGEVVNLGDKVFTAVFNVMGNAVFSRDVLNVEDEEGSILKHNFDKIVQLAFYPNVADFYPCFGWMDIQGLNREQEVFIKKIYGIWDEYIQERRKNDDERNTRHDFLNALLNSGCSDLQLKALISDMFVAGTDTTVVVIDWTMSELVKNPKAMHKVRDELKQVVGERREGENAVKESHLSHLTFLQACIKESLRLHPPTPLLVPRQALEDCEVLNYTIPKESKVMVNAWAMGRDPKIWNDPSTFLPERFLNSNLDYKGNDFEFIPFGAGRRICIGMPLASRTVGLIVASLIHTFDWSLPDGMQPNELNMEEKFGFTLERAKPLLLIPNSVE